MKNIFKQFKVGNTPLVELSNFEAKYDLKAKIYAKIEGFNPAGSIKDRIALGMIKDAIDNGKVNPNTTFIEPTSGNTGIAIAYFAKQLGYKCILTMPESMSLARRKLLVSYGARLELTPASEGMKGSIRRANELLKEITDSIILGQFDNLVNPKVHYETTGPEIFEQLNGEVDIFIAGVGTGGTISGVSKYLKERKNVKVFAVEPSTSPVLSSGVSGKHRIQGIGAGFIPNTLNTKSYDKVITVSSEDAIKTSLEIDEVEHTKVGISSGAALFAALLEAKKDENKGKNIVVIFPDNIERYTPEDFKL